MILSLAVVVAVEVARQVVLCSHGEVSDAVAVLQYIANAGKYPIAGKSLKYADCDGVAGITGSDAIMIQRFDAGIIKKFPAEK